jgi:YD repeat-containing protein
MVGCALLNCRALSSTSKRPALATKGFRSLKLLPWSFLALCLISIGGSALCAAQTGNLGDAVQHPIPGAGHDYIHMLNETVNPENGSLNIKISLPTPSGRGLSLPFALTYNSGEVFEAVSGPYASGGGQMDFSTPASRSHNGHGWSDTLPYATASALLGYVYSAPPSSTAGYGAVGTCPITMFYNFYDPSGGSHMLGLAAIGTETPLPGLQPTQGCNQATLSTTLSQPYYASQQSGGDDQVSASMTANCTGSNSTTIEECDDGAPSFKVTDEESNVYSFPANAFGTSSPGPAQTQVVFPTQIEDRNGNIINFSSVPADSIAGVLPVIDTLGRTLISSNQPQPVAPTQYTVGGLTYNVGYTAANANFTPTATLYPTPSFSTSQVTCNFPTTVAASGLNMVGTITLPNQQKYTFTYDPTYGLVNKITYPDGGWVSYTWELSPQQSTLATFSGLINNGGAIPVSGLCNWRYQTPVILTRTVGYSSTSGPVLTQSFNYSTSWMNSPVTSWSTKTTTVTTTDNLSLHQSKTVYTYSSVPQPIQPNAPGMLQAQLPVESQIQTYDLGTTGASSTLLQTVNKTWADQFAMSSEQTITPAGTSENVSENVYCYDPQSDLPIEKDEYAFGVAGPAIVPPAYGGVCGSPTPTRKTTYGYAIGAAPCQTIVYGSTGIRVAETDAYIDGGTLPCVSGKAATLPVTGGLPTKVNTHDEGSYASTAPIVRGNPTTVVHWLNTGSAITSTAKYDEAGQIVSTTDPCGNGTCADINGGNHTTTYSYADSPAEGNAAGNSDAYLTQITDPLGEATEFTYNYATGQVASGTDENGQPTSYSYSDSLLRLTDIYGPPSAQNGNAKPHTNYYYVDGSAPSIKTTNPIGVVSTSYRDGMGHVTQTQLNSTYIVDTHYDGEGNVLTKSNPHLTSASPTDGTITYYYDALGRPIEELEQDGVSKLQWGYDGLCSVPAVANCSASHLGSGVGNWVDSTDELGNHWQRTSDAFGRLIEVMEPSGASQSPSMETDYSYDWLNNLTTVTQHGLSTDTARTRSFLYDSVSRLLWSQNPESGVVCYGQGSGTVAGCQPNGYDANGNLATKTDARSVTTSYLYDAINRLVSKAYQNDSSGSASFCYQYGSSATTNQIGRLIADWTQKTSGAACPGSPPSNPITSRVVNAYDEMGRVKSETQCVGSKCSQDVPSNSTYSYDLVGNLTTFGNLTGTSLFTNAYDSFGRLCLVSAVSGSTCSQGTTPSAANLFSNPFYTPGGALSGVTYGTGLTLTRTYDPRLRITGEKDMGTVGESPAVPGAAVITITGALQ